VELREPIKIFSKIFEFIFKSQVSQYFELNNLFSPYQFAFRPGMSTVGSVESLVSEIISSFEGGEITKAVLCDLNKAFDCVDHDILLKKLQKYGLIGSEINFVKSYLTDRQQKVFVNNNYSKPTSVVCGVPQGSVLGPFLYLVMINDLPANIVTSKVLFADDVTLFHSEKSVENLNLIMSYVVEESAQWFSVNKFLLNNEKTQVINFSLEKDTANDVEAVKLLGINLDVKLTWHVHVDETCKRLARVIYVIRHLKNCIPDVYLRNVYFALFHSVLSYGILFWGNSTSIGNILLLQKKVVRLITNSHFRGHCRPLFQNLT